jgi:hypothetical protein
LKRQDDTIVTGDGDERKERRFSNGEINRELTRLKRICNLARQNGKLTHVPYIPMLKERNVRTGFFEREQMEPVLAHLVEAARKLNAMQTVRLKPDATTDLILASLPRRSRAAAKSGTILGTVARQNHVSPINQPPSS